MAEIARNTPLSHLNVFMNSAHICFLFFRPVLSQGLRSLREVRTWAADVQFAPYMLQKVSSPGILRLAGSFAWHILWCVLEPYITLYHYSCVLNACLAAPPQTHVGPRNASETNTADSRNSELVSPADRAGSVEVSRLGGLRQYVVVYRVSGDSGSSFWILLFHSSARRLWQSQSVHTRCGLPGAFVHVFSILHVPCRTAFFFIGRVLSFLPFISLFILVCR